MTLPIAENEKINENIKKREEILSNEENYFAEYANLVAFFQTDIQQYLSSSLCEQKREIRSNERLHELSLWIDIDTNLKPTKILIGAVNGYLRFLNEILCESYNFDFSKSKFRSIHFKFDEILAKYYEKVLNSFSFQFPEISPLKVNETEHRRPPNFNDRLISIINNRCLNSKMLAVDRQSIDQFQEMLKNYKMYEIENKIEVLKQIYIDLQRTYKEFAYILSDESSCNINVKDFVSFPPLDIIKSNPQYQQFLSNIPLLRDQVITNFNELNTKISSLFTLMNNYQRKLENSFVFPQINFEELEQIATNYSDSITKNMIAAYYYKVLKKINTSDQYPLKAFIKKIYKKYLAISQTEDLNPIRSLLKELLSILNQKESEKAFKQQEKDQISVQKEFKESLSRELPKSNMQRPPDAEEHLSKKREEISNLSKKYKDQRKEFYDELLESVKSFSTKIQNIHYSPLFPEQIEQMDHTISIQAAQMELETRRSIRQSEDKQKYEKEIPKMNEKLEQLKIEIQNKKKQIATLKAKQNSSKISNPNLPCLCLHCHQGQISHVISKCGHAFCSDCIMDKEACPICGEAITKSDVCEIHWF